MSTGRETSAPTLFNDERRRVADACTDAHSHGGNAWDARRLTRLVDDAMRLVPVGEGLPLAPLSVVIHMHPSEHSTVAGLSTVERVLAHFANSLAYRRGLIATAEVQVRVVPKRGVRRGLPELELFLP